jgi:hypothetical protein
MSGKAKTTKYPRWEQETADTVVSSFRRLSPGMRVEVFEDLQRMCGSTASGDSKKAKSQAQAGAAAPVVQAGAAATVKTPVPVVARKDGTPQLRVHADLRASPIISSFEGMTREQRKEPEGQKLNRYISVLTAAHVRYSKGSKTDTEKTQWTELVALNSTEFEARIDDIKLSFGGIKPPQI